MESPENARLVGGWWFPTYDRDFPRFVKVNQKTPEHPLDIDGRVLYQRQKILPALDRMGPGRRRLAIDVGAHVGMICYQLCSEFEFVHAFEPVHEVGRLLQHNVPFSNYRYHDCALGRQHDMIQMAHGESLSGDNWITKKRGKIPVFPLDDFALRNVDLIKIDVQGSEMDVVEGARRTLLGCRPVVILEQKGFDLSRFDHKKHAALKYLKALGMKCFFVSAGDYSLDWV